jgi:hypothetical protein
MRDTLLRSDMLANSLNSNHKPVLPVLVTGKIERCHLWVGLNQARGPLNGRHPSPKSTPNQAAQFAAQGGIFSCCHCSAEHDDDGDEQRRMSTGARSSQPKTRFPTWKRRSSSSSSR